MPYTFNGIGTTYYGEQNRSVTQGTCEFCHRQADIKSYDTREFFVVVFIPVIPLRKYRILRECSRCRRHRRIRLSEFQRAVNNEVAPLRESVTRQPADEQNHLKLIHALIGLAMTKEAEDAARAATEQVPSSSSLFLIAGELAIERGDLNAAIPFLERSAQMDPAAAQPRISLGESLARLGRYQEALTPLEEARRLDSSGQPGLPYLLGDAYLNLARFGEALECYEKVAGLVPEASKDKQLLRKIRKCKEELGYPLSDAEKRARRSWWPFAKKRAAPHTYRQPVSNMRALALLGILAGVALVGVAAYAFWNQNHAEVYFDNGMAARVNVKVDGEEFSVPQWPVKKTLAPGVHGVVVRDVKGKEIEHADIEVRRQGFWDSLFNRQFHVYNVAEAHIYRVETVGYSATESGRTYSATLLPFRHFFSHPTVEYMFQTPPESIQIQGSSAVRTAFNVARDLNYPSLGVDYYNQGKLKDAERALRKGVELAPCSLEADRNMVDFLNAQGRAGEALEFSRHWLSTCTGSRIEAHRAYQDSMRRTGNGEQVLAEYRSRLDREPQSALNHYLYGRLLDDPEVSVTEYQKAVSIDPKLMRARGALGGTLIELERYDEAMGHLEASFQLHDYDPDFVVMYAHASIGADKAERAVRVLATINKKGQKTREFFQAGWLLDLACQRWTSAEKRLGNNTTAANVPPAVWPYKLQLLELSNRRQEAERLLALSAKRKDLADLLPFPRIEMMLEKEQYEQAAASLDRDFPSEQAPLLYRTYLAAGLAMSGNAGAATEQARKVVSTYRRRDQLDDEDFAVMSMADHLLGNNTAEDVIQAARRADYLMLPPAYYVLAAREKSRGNREHARELFARCARACVTLDFPLLDARRLSQ